MALDLRHSAENSKKVLTEGAKFASSPMSYIRGRMGMPRSVNNHQSAYADTQQPVMIDNLHDAIMNNITGNIDYQRNWQSALRAEETSAREAEKARKWQEEMSNTAYSRAINDLKKNGINPYAIGLFSPATTPSGATAQAYTGATPPKTYDFVSEMFGFAKTAMQQKHEEKLSLIKLLASIFS